MHPQPARWRNGPRPVVQFRKPLYFNAVVSCTSSTVRCSALRSASASRCGCRMSSSVTLRLCRKRYAARWPAARLSGALPARRPVARARPPAAHKGLQQQRSHRVLFLPVLRQPPRRLPQGMARQVRHPYPGQDGHKIPTLGMRRSPSITGSIRWPGLPARVPLRARGQPPFRGPPAGGSRLAAGPAQVLAYAPFPPACSATPCKASRHHCVRACQQPVHAARATCPAPSGQALGAAPSDSTRRESGNQLQSGASTQTKNGPVLDNECTKML